MVRSPTGDHPARPSTHRRHVTGFDFDLRGDDVDVILVPTTPPEPPLYGEYAVSFDDIDTVVAWEA